MREGFEPSKASPSDLQSDPFGRSGTSPDNKKSDSWREDLNPQQADYKSAALPIELRQQLSPDISNLLQVSVNKKFSYYQKNNFMEQIIYC